MEKNNLFNRLVGLVHREKSGALTTSLETPSIMEQPFAFESYTDIESWEGCYVSWLDYTFILGPHDGLELESGGIIRAVSQDSLVYQKPTGMIIPLPAFNPKVSLEETIKKLDTQIDILKPIESEPTDERTRRFK